MNTGLTGTSTTTTIVIGNQVKQAQPPTTTLDAALRLPFGRNTATGVSDTWSEANLCRNQVFSCELQKGERYTQADPIGAVRRSGSELESNKINKD